MHLSIYDKECLMQAKDMIEKDNKTHYKITEIAAKVGLSPTKLKKGFRLAFGMALYEFLQDQRMQKALIMLDDPKNELKQISKALGFRYTNNFIAAFKKKFSKTPGSIKKSKEKDY